MHRIATGLLLTLGLLATSAVSAGAQVFGYGGNLPSGSYQQSCSNARMNGATLSASCTTNNGQQRWSSMNVNGCNGDIANNNGQLTCNGGYYNGGYNNGGYNNGGYDNNGRGRDRDDEDNDDNGNGNGHAYGHRHHHNNGRWNNNGGYNNGGYNGGYNNGGYGYGYGLPGGSYRQSCQNARMNGSMLSASCTAPNGQWIGSSIDVRRCQSRDIANRNGYLSC